MSEQQRYNVEEIRFGTRGGWQIWDDGDSSGHNVVDGKTYPDKGLALAHCQELNDALKLDPRIRTELENKFPAATNAINAYLKFIVIAAEPQKKDGHHRHHILPRNWFSKYEDFEQNPWNIKNLSLKDHGKAHKLFNVVAGVGPKARFLIQFRKETLAILRLNAKETGIPVAAYVRMVVERALKEEAA